MLALRRSSPRLVGRAAGAAQGRLLSPTLAHVRCLTWLNRGDGYTPYDHLEDGDHPTIHGEGKLACIWGGFGFKKRQMQKHMDIYAEHGFQTHPIFSSIRELTTPKIGEERGKRFAEELQAIDKEIVFHTISGSVWTLINTLHYMDRDFRERKVRAIAFDSSPPKSDIYAFGGWLSYALQKPGLKNVAAPLFAPYRWAVGINDAWEAENHRRMFGNDDQCVIPATANILFMHGRHDPVLDPDYVTEYATFLRARAQAPAQVNEVLFAKARHSMAIVEHPDAYKAAHITHLLGSVEGWSDGARASANPATAVPEAIFEEAQQSRTM